MTNPNNAIGTNAAYSGRTSANAFNDVLAVLSRGIISGWACAPDSGMSVVLGGDGTTRDVAIAEDNIGNRTTINNISGSPVSVTISTAPVTNSRIDLIVAYVDNPPEGSSTVTDNYEACGLVTVQGLPAETPLVPDDSAIRTAITTDGGSGVTAYYVILAQITVASGTTDIDDTMIQQGGNAGIANQNIQDGTISRTKFAPFALNNAIMTTENLSPSEDTPTGWWNLLNSLGAQYKGFYVTRYNQSGKFDHQPSTYGHLMMMNNATDVIQIWFQYNNSILYRVGNAAGWRRPSTGSWASILDDLSLGTIDNSSISFTKSTPVSSGNPFAFIVSKQGKNVFLQGNVNITGSINAYSNFMTLPTSISPNTDITLTVGDRRVDIRYNGSVQCHTALSNGDTIAFSASYASR